MSSPLTSYTESTPSTYLKVLITGSSGLIGTALAGYLEGEGCSITRLVRRPEPGRAGFAFWDPQAGSIDTAALEGHDAVVNLAGENIASGLWTPAQKARLRDSRILGTRLLAETLAGLTRPPKVLLSASAIGYYGDRDSEILKEESPKGEGFLADLCRDWEDAASPARSSGIRVAHPRIGIVLSPDGGALAKMLPLFRWGLGGTIGGGGSYMSWISLPDLVRAFHHVINNKDVAGPFNAVAPNPVTNREFTQTLARILRRPAMLPVPAFALRALLGQMANETILSSARAEPEKLTQSGFQFSHPTLEQALKAVL